MMITQPTIKTGVNKGVFCAAAPLMPDPFKSDVRRYALRATRQFKKSAQSHKEN
jgi:hypothetical protein